MEVLADNFKVDDKARAVWAAGGKEIQNTLRGHNTSPVPKPLGPGNCWLYHPRPFASGDDKEQEFASWNQPVETPEPRNSSTLRLDLAFGLVRFVCLGLENSPPCRQ